MNISNTSETVKTIQLENIMDMLKSIPLSDIDRIDCNVSEYDDGSANFELSLSIKKYEEPKISTGNISVNDGTVYCKMPR